MEKLHIPIFIFIIFLCFSLRIDAQHAENTRISDIDFSFTDSAAIISYSFVNPDKNYHYVISTFIIDKNGNKYIPSSVSGDIYPRNGGYKRIYWNLKKDSASLDGFYYLRITVNTLPTHKTAQLLLYSTIIPGSGQYKINNKAASWLWALSCFGIAGLSWYYNDQAAEKYENYRQSTMPSEANTYFEQSYHNIQLSRLMAGLSGTLWLGNLYDTYKKSKKPNLNRKENTCNNKGSIYAESGLIYINTNISDNVPQLSIQKETVRFFDENGNNYLEPEENAVISFHVKNTGKTIAHDIYCHIDATADKNFVKISSPRRIEYVLPGESHQAELLICGSADMNSRVNEATVFCKTGNKPCSDTATITFYTRQNYKPEIIFDDFSVDFILNDDSLNHKVLIFKTWANNIGKGTGIDVKADFNIPPALKPYGQTSFEIGRLKPGDRNEIELRCYPIPEFCDSVIQLSANIHEKFEKFGENKIFTINLSQY
jgi:hypothetical protein